MPEKPQIVSMLPQDDINSRIIIERIRTKGMRDESTILLMVGKYEFSSVETRQHVADSLICLLKSGAFDQPEPKGVHVGMVDTDARALMTDLLSDSPVNE